MVKAEDSNLIKDRAELEDAVAFPSSGLLYPYGLDLIVRGYMLFLS